MSKNYNLQIPIDKELECKLRTIADKEDRALRSLCRRILQSYAEEYEALESKTIEKVIDDTKVEANSVDDFDFDL